MGGETDTLKQKDFLTALESFIEMQRIQQKLGSDINIPLSLFNNRRLGVLEILVKYLKENKRLTYGQIASLLKRDDRTIWTAYQQANTKYNEPFNDKDTAHHVPCSIFSDRKLGPLEVLTLYSRNELKLSFIEISALLNRHYPTIWLSYNNALRKRNTNEQTKAAIA